MKATCPDLPLLEKPATLETLHRHDGDVVDLYNECAWRHDALIEALRKRGL